MNNNKKTEELDIFKSVRSSAIQELTPDVLETSLDFLLKSGTLKDIPVFGLIFKSYGLYKNVSEAFFTRKLLKFLLELKDISQSKREKFIEKLESKNETNRAGEKLLIILNRFDDEDKAKIAGRLFKKTILDEITFDNFKRLIYIIDNSYLEDLKLLKDNKLLRNIDDNIKSNLYQVGLLNQTIKDKRKHEQYLFERTGSKEIIPATFEYKLNIFGKILIDNGFDK